MHTHTIKSFMLINPGTGFYRPPKNSYCDRSSLKIIIIQLIAIVFATIFYLEVVIVTVLHLTALSHYSLY